MDKLSNETQEKTKNVWKRVLIIVTFIVVLIAFNLYVIHLRMGFKLTREELQSNLLQEFKTEKENYQDIYPIEENRVIVYIGSYGKAGVDYACYVKTPFTDKWRLESRNALRAFDNPSEKYKIAFTGTLYISVNTDNINRAVVTENGEQKEIEIKSKKPFALIVEESAESVTFFTQDGEEISGEEFGE